MCQLFTLHTVCDTVNIFHPKLTELNHKLHLKQMKIFSYLVMVTSIIENIRW